MRAAALFVSKVHWAKIALVLTAVVFISFLIILPLVEIFSQAFSLGLKHYLHAIGNAETLRSLYLTLVTAAIAVPMNLVFGVVAAYAIAKFDFFGKSFLIAVIDLPFAVSPVIAGLIYILVFGLQGLFGQFLGDHNLRIIFALPGIVLTTIFVTLPFVARELIPLIEEQGKSEEEAALLLGASPLKMFFFVTLPNIRWGLIYGVILCNARAMGEFGAVSVVSGHIRGETTTLPLQAEILYNEYNFADAFAVASLLALVAFATLLIKKVLEMKIHGRKKKS